MSMDAGSRCESVDILLVEENPHDAELLFHSLHKYRLSNAVVWAKDGDEALKVLRSTVDAAAGASIPPKLVLLNVKLPKVDGHEVLRQMKTDPVLRSIPVLILASSREEVEQFRRLENGADGYIIKPVEFKNLFSAIRDLARYWLLLDEAPPGQPEN